MSNILLKVLGNNDDAKAVIADTTKDVQEFGKERATAELRVDAARAKADIAEVIAEMKAVPKEETIRIRVAAEQSKLQTLMARRQGLEGKLGETAAAGGNTDALVQRLGTYNQRIEAVRGRIEGLAADFEKLGQEGERDVSKLTKGVAGLAGGLTRARTGAVSFVSGLVEKVPLIGGLFAKVAEGVGSLATKLLPEAGQGAISLVGGFAGLVVVGPILAVIVGAMLALVVSIGQALIGIVALGAAFLVMLGPIIAVLGVVLVKIKDIVSGQVALKQATANLKSAYDAQKSAVTQLHQAEATQSTTRLQAIQAQRQALLALQDANNGVKDSELGVQSAKLQLQQAKLTLRAFKQELAGMGTGPGDLLGKSSNVAVSGNFGQTQQGSSPLAWLRMLLQYKQDLLDVKTAAQGTKDAVQGVKDATNNQLTAQETWAQFAKRGLKAYQPYMQAVNGTVTATQNLKRADDQLAAAELAKSLAIRHGTKEAGGFMAMWKKLKDTLGKILGPAEAAVFKGIETSMGILAGHGKTLTPAFTKLGIAIGNAFVFFAKMMSKPGNVELIKRLIEDSAKFTKTMSHWLGSALKFIIQIGTDAAPALIGIFKHWASQLSTANGHTLNLKKFIQDCIGKATMFWHMILNVGGAVIKLQGFFKTLMGIISPLLTSLSKIVELYQTIAAIQAANAQGAGTGAQALKGTGALIAKDERLLKGNISEGFRAFLQTQIKNLQSQVKDITGNSFGLRVAGPQKLLTQGGAKSSRLTVSHQPSAINVHQQYVLPEGTDPDHFARKQKKNLQSLGHGLATS